MKQFYIFFIKQLTNDFILITTPALVNGISLSLIEVWNQSLVALCW